MCTLVSRVGINLPPSSQQWSSYTSSNDMNVLPVFGYQATNANNAISIHQDGTNTIHVRHLAKVNSACILYCIVMSTPIAKPRKNLMIANICHDTENTASRFKTTSEAIDRNKGNFRPIKSAICPARRFPVNTPAICIDVIVCGTQAMSQSKFH